MSDDRAVHTHRARLDNVKQARVMVYSMRPLGPAIFCCRSNMPTARSASTLDLSLGSAAPHNATLIGIGALTGTLNEGFYGAFTTAAEP